MVKLANEQLLEQKLEAVEKARAWSARAVAKLESLIRSGSDEALYRINPLKFAVEKNLSENEAIDLFVFAAKHGLFEMNWHLLCPACTQVVESFRNLKQLHPGYFCAMCQTNYEATLDDYIEVAFTVNPQVADISFHHPDSLSVEDFYFKHSFSSAGRVGDVRWVDILRSLTKLITYLEPGERKPVQWRLDPGMIIAIDRISNSAFFLPVGSSGESSIRVPFVDGNYAPSATALRAGDVTLEFENESSKRASLLLFYLTADQMQKKRPPTLDPFLTAKKLLSTQSFRRMFGGEAITGNDSLKVKDLTFLFTDLKGSTNLYDRIGDLKAFSLVQQHFDSLERIVQAHEGAIVKTIGDAVMATFLTPLDALKAAVEMLEEIDQFNRSRGTKDIILKIGMHKGSAIAVTLNERLDYFGQTVNIAARVQALADSEEIYVTDEVYGDPAVKEFIRSMRVEPMSAALKGIEEKVKVYRVVPEHEVASR